MNLLIGLSTWILLLLIFFLHWGISTLWERRRQRRQGAGADAEPSPRAEASSKAQAR